MRLALACATLLLGAGQAQAKTLYFTGDPATNRWCVFAAKAAMLGEAERLRDAAFSAGIRVGEGELERGEIVRLEVVAGPESGDWAMTDTYRLRGGRVVAVERTTGYASGEPRTFQTFAWRAGAWRPDRDWGGPGYLPVEPPEADLTSQPYYLAVAQAARASVPAKGVCRTFPRR